MGKIMRNGNKYSCASPNNAQSVVYDNTTSGLEAENTKEAIDELSSKIDEQNENKQNQLQIHKIQNGLLAGGYAEETPISSNCLIIGWQGEIDSSKAQCYYRPESNVIYITSEIQQVVHLTYVTF